MPFTPIVPYPGDTVSACLTTGEAPRCQATMAPSPKPELISSTDFPFSGR